MVVLATSNEVVKLINAQQAAISQVNQAAQLASNNVSPQKVSSSAKKMSVNEMVRERLKMQEEIKKAYPDLPLLDTQKVNTYTDYAYASHDQAVFLIEAMNEIKSMHESHFMTKKNKQLIQEKKALEEELSLAKSFGPGDSQNAAAQMQLEASQNAHKVTANRIKEIEAQFQGLLQQEKQKADRS